MTESYDAPGKSYRPSNGTEGEIFMESWCARCDRDAAHRRDPDRNEGCDIIARTMAFDITDPNYPTEWTYDENGFPCCTAWNKEGLPPRCDQTLDMFDV